MNNQFNKAIIDTCVLLDALMINYMSVTSNNNLINKWGQIIFQGNDIYQDKYTRFLKSIQTFITTTHVIGELQGLVNSRLGIKDELKISFWETSINYLSYKKLDEKIIKLLVLGDNHNYAKCLYDIGFVDTGLIELAIKEKLTIITRDSNTLIQRARQFDCLTFNPEYQLNSKFH